MIKAIATVLSLVIAFSLARAQNAPVKFGDVSLEELTMRSYEKDTSASAVILADYGTSSIEYRQDVGFVLEFERITRIKIFTKHGLAYGNFTIPLSKDDAYRIGEFVSFRMTL